MPTYLIYGVTHHTDFRREELESLAKLYDISVDFSSHTQTSPFFTVSLKNDEEAKLLVSRSILNRGIYELMCSGDSYDACHENLRAHERYPFPEFEQVSFKFCFEAYEATRSKDDQRTAIESFSHLGWLGKIDMRNPEYTFAILEEWEAGGVDNNSRTFRRVFFGRHVGGTSRHLIGTYDLKKRGYLGTTSMESELSLVSANQVLARPNVIIYDPFVGTGSFLVTSAAFGATVLGSDIDGRQIKGPAANDKNIEYNFDQYNLTDLLLDCLTFDVKHPPWHSNFRVSGILGDPPYGVRAGAKTLGRAPGTKLYGRQGPTLTPDGTFVHARENYIPPKKPYELSDLADDFLDYAAELLEDGGRLVFWLPTVNEDYSPVDLPQRSDMTLIANSTQNFGRWSRRLLTYCRVPRSSIHGGEGKRLERVRQPGHVDFRYKYYSRFGNGKQVDEVTFSRMTPKEREYFSVSSDGTAQEGH